MKLKVYPRLINLGTPFWHGESNGVRRWLDFTGGIRTLAWLCDEIDFFEFCEKIRRETPFAPSAFFRAHSAEHYDDFWLDDAFIGADDEYAGADEKLKRIRLTGKYAYYPRMFRAWNYVDDAGETPIRTCHKWWSEGGAEIWATYCDWANGSPLVDEDATRLMEALADAYRENRGDLQNQGRVWYAEPLVERDRRVVEWLARTPSVEPGAAVGDVDVLYLCNPGAWSANGGDALWRDFGGAPPTPPTPRPYVFTTREKAIDFIGRAAKIPGYTNDIFQVAETEWMRLKKIERPEISTATQELFDRARGIVGEPLYRRSF